jgi:hypothetical protein
VARLLTKEVSTAPSVPVATQLVMTASMSELEALAKLMSCVTYASKSLWSDDGSCELKLHTCVTIANGFVTPVRLALCAGPEA